MAVDMHDRHCRTCTHAEEAWLSQAQKLRTEGYALGTGAFRHGIGLICHKRKVIGPSKPCDAWEREIGADDAHEG